MMTLVVCERLFFGQLRLLSLLPLEVVEVVGLVEVAQVAFAMLVALASVLLLHLFRPCVAFRRGVLLAFRRGVLLAFRQGVLLAFRRGTLMDALEQLKCSEGCVSYAQQYRLANFLWHT